MAIMAMENPPCLSIYSWFSHGIDDAALPGFELSEEMVIHQVIWGGSLY